MGPEQWLFLQWHEHKGSLVSTFEKLFERNTFVDCTLAAEGQYLNVHKMILSACSPYFEILLNENRDKHPIIILKDVKFRSLKSIIEYMYRGEANVLSTEMTDFLAAAETLQIKGIGKQGGGDTRTQPKNLRDLMEEQSRPPCPTMQIIKEEKDNWADSDLSSALTETVQDSFVTQNAVLFSQGDAGATIALPQKLPKAEAAAEEAEAAAPGLGSHTEPVRPAAPPADWAGAASAGDAGPLEAAPKAEADADLPAPAPPPAPAPAPRPPPADMEDAETASLGSSVIELSDTTEEWAEEEDMDEGQAAHAHALAPAAEESRARFEAASDVARDSASRDLGSEQGYSIRAPQDDFLNDVITMMRSLEIHFLATKRIPLTPGVVTTTGKRFPSRPAVGGTSSGTGGGGGGGNGGAPQRRTSLSRHRGRHSPNRHVCPICDMSFPWLNLLKRHMRTHVSQQIYSCKDCDYTTRDRRDFAKHVLIHTWHKPHYDELKEESGAKRGKHKARAHRHAPRVPHTRTHPRAHPRPRAHPCRESPRAREGGATAAAGATAGKFRCNQCHLEFASKRLLMRHINCVHGYPERRLSSEESGSSAASSP